MHIILERFPKQWINQSEVNTSSSDIIREILNYLSFHILIVDLLLLNLIVWPPASPFLPVAALRKVTLFGKIGGSQTP